MIWQFLSWYLIVQLITVAALPLCATLFVNLPDRGYAFAKSLGVLLVGFCFWLGYSYGLLRNETGGAWLALLLVALFSWTVGRSLIQQLRGNGSRPFRWRQVLSIEVLFLAAFAFWAYVRAHDPAVNHTEEPMDLMFMNSIWVSPTYPPQDAWLSGYAISYYYFGYWLLTTLGRLAGQPPEIAYTLGQASWYGMLWIGCFGLVYNLLAYRDGNGQSPIWGGLLGAISVAFAANPQGFFEWLHAKGYDISGLARWFNVTNFPPAIGSDTGQTGNWYVSYDWWWWRASRVISDRGLDGGHMEVIDEFPIFSYVLGDNHPHVMAMPIAILIIALALNLFLNKRRVALPIAVRTLDAATTEKPNATVDDGKMDSEVASEATSEVVGAMDTPKVSSGTSTASATPTAGVAEGWLPPLLRSPAALREFTRSGFPLGFSGALVTTVAMGSLIFLNTWDLPAYWLLLVLSMLTLVWRNLGAVSELGMGRRWQQTAVAATLVAVGLLLGSWLLYYPYLLTAQSQASGILPNFFNPTRFPQFLLMFGFALFAVLGLLGISWQRLARANVSGGYGVVGIITGLILGVPTLFLLLTTLLATNTERGRQLLAGNVPLPEGSESYLPYILERWGSGFWTFLIIGLLVSGCAWLAWRLLHQVSPITTKNTTAAARTDETTLFVLFLATIGLLLLFAPEFVYLRDNFGTRMNTVFKFYYQAWLLLGITSSYVIVTAIGGLFSRRTESVAEGAAISGENSALRWGTFTCALLSLLIVGTGLFYPVMAVYSKTGGFNSERPTFNTVAYIQDFSPNEWAAISWIRTNTAGDALVLESKGNSYDASTNRVSTITGRPTLMGWEGHELQWRGAAFGEMAEGRAQAMETIYRGGTPDQLRQVLDTWQIEYVYIGPIERRNYSVPPQAERNLAEVMNLVFEAGDVRVYQRRQ